MSIELFGHGPGTAQAWAAFQMGRRKYPGTSRLTIDYRGTHPRVTPDYTPRASGSVRSQQDALARRLAEIQRRL
jgi:hypothetical protein